VVVMRSAGGLLRVMCGLTNAREPRIFGFMAKQEFSIPKIADRVRTEADAYLMLEELRWGGAPTACPKCGGMDRCHYIAPKNGTDRKTRTGSASQRRVWFCGHCRKQFSVLTGTIFHGTRIPVRTWLLVMFDFCAAKNSISAWEISRRYEITNESAWHMLHRIREAMKREPLAGLLTGAIVSDETWYGGKPKNRHRSHAGRSGFTDKQPIVSLIHKESGEVRSVAVPTVNGENLTAILRENVDIPASVLHTDAAQIYRTIGMPFSDHQSVSHADGEYVRDGVSTNTAEGFFSQLKRSLDGTQHHVSVEHLPRYLSEFDFRYSTRKMDDSERMRLMIGRTDGRRLPYAPLTADGPVRVPPHVVDACM